MKININLQCNFYNIMSQAFQDSYNEWDNAMAETNPEFMEELILMFKEFFKMKRPVHLFDFVINSQGNIEKSQCSNYNACLAIDVPKHHNTLLNTLQHIITTHNLKNVEFELRTIPVFNAKSEFQLILTRKMT